MNIPLPAETHTSKRTIVPPMEPGDHLTRDEFKRRYEAMPRLKKAELIEVPGLWIDAGALVAGNMVRVPAVARRGVGSSEHARFLARMNQQSEQGEG